MIPAQNIVAWGRKVPWSEQRQVEQDLIICRAIVELFRDPFLAQELRFRGGTALNKLQFPAPMRYSEDIDLVRTTKGPLKPLFDKLHEVLDPWLGEPEFVRSRLAPKLRFKVPAEDGSGEIRLKVEINIWETQSYDAPVTIPFAVDNPWFTGTADIATFSREEQMATKLRALLQRDKGRDLYDLGHALDVFKGLNLPRVIECFGFYLKNREQAISRAEAEQRMFAKFANPSFLTDMRPLLPAAAAAALDEAATQRTFEKVFREFIIRIPGDPWKRTEEMKRKFKLLL